MKRGVVPLFFCLWAGLLTIWPSPFISFAQTQSDWVAKAVSVQGTVEVQRVGNTQWQPVKLNDTYCPGDTIRVQERSRADVAMLDQSVLRLECEHEHHPSKA